MFGIVIVATVVASGSLFAQTATPRPTSEPAATQPEAGAADLRARVVEVSGDVHAAPVGTGALDAAGWKPVKKDDELSSGTQIRTGLRSHVVLLFGDDTVVSVRRATLASIDQFYQSQTTRTVRLGLGYGVVRGGTTEGTLRSSVVVDSPVATLAKRGTEGWEMEVEPYTGRFRISLARSGLIEAIQKHTGQRRLVHVGQYANQLNIATMWVNQAIFDRAVKFVSAGSMTQADTDFNTEVTGSWSSAGPGAGSNLPAFAGRARPGDALPPRFDRQFQSELDRLLQRFNLIVTEPGNFFRPEGNFGVKPNPSVLIDSREAGKLRGRR